MEKEQKQGINGGTIIIIMIICIIVGMAPGYILGEKIINKKEATTEQKEQKKDNSKEEATPEVEQPKEEENNNQKQEETSKKSTSLDVSKDCFNSGKCEKEYELSNGEKTIKVRIMSNSSSIYIYLNDNDILQFNISDPNMGNKSVNKIALLDTNHLVIETKSSARKERYYFDNNNSMINHIFEAPYDTNNTFANDITSKEEIHYYSALGCDSQGKYRSLYKYKFTIISSTKYSIEYIGEAKTVCAGQS